MGKVYVITSGKGGTGKTTSAVNLGSAFNKLGEEAVIIDANLTTPNVGLYFGAPIVPLNLNHVMQGKANVEDAIYEHESGVKIIPSSLSLKEAKKIDYDSLSEVAKNLRKNFEHVIMDSAAGLGEEARSAIEVGDEIVVVANPNILSVTDALKTIKLAEELNKNVKGVIVTKVNGKRSEMSIQNIKEMLEVPILGIVPEDEAVNESLARKNAVIHTHPRSKASRAYQNIAAKILGKRIKEESFFDRLLGSLGLR